MSETPTTGDAAAQPTVYQVRDYIDAAQMKRDLAFSTNDLTTAMMEQSALFSHYGVLAAQASHQVDVVKMLLENTEAAVYKAERDRLASSGEKFTETLLEKIVSRHSRVISMKKALNEAKRIESIGKIAVEGFRHRRDMLVQQGLISREEMKGELKIAERNVREDVQAQQREAVLQQMAQRNAA
ncbi:hypothetical protein [Ancylobacter rudongensis]|uniref:Uncharacterized protein n=1 Tax=Ancylobacter rudongensis TaxID=177413 RepID=A0A1G4USK9_9HYPH|nr:hypothetical protein [Ancylobacter rudongensis]SCW95779.1 hypothetical protein SAMN05660859_0116 [Ancylobacter rudongensis]